MGQSGAGFVNTPFSLTGAGSAPVSTPFSTAPAYSPPAAQSNPYGIDESGFNSAMDALNHSTDGLNTNWQAPTLTNPFTNRVSPLASASFVPLSGDMFTSMGSGGPASSGSAVPAGAPGNNSDGSFLDNLTSMFEHSAPVQWFAHTNVGQWLAKEGASSMNSLGTYINDMKNGGLGAVANLYSGDTQKAVDQYNSNNLKDPVQAYTDAYNNPSIAASAPTGRQNFDNAILGGHDIPFLSMLGGFATSFIDPASLTPVGAVAKGIAAPIKGAIGALKGGAETAAHVAEPVAEATAHAPMDENFASLADTYTPNDFNMHDVSAPQMAKPNPMESQGSVFENPTGQSIEQATNPHAQPLADLNAEISNLQNEHDSLAKALLQELNGTKDQGILNDLQSAGVRRPLQGDNFYSEYRNLPPSVQRLFQAGNVGQGALSLDEFAAKKGSDVPSVLDALNNAKKNYTLQDVLDHPALQDHQQALQMLQELRDAVQAEHDGWAQTAAASAPDHFSLGHDENFGNLLNHIGGAPIGEEPTLAKEAAGGAKTTPFTPTPQPQRNPFVQSFKTMFDKGHGLSDAEKQAFVDANAHNSLLSYSAQKAFDDLRAQFPQLTKEDLNNIGHMVEGTMPMDPRLEPFVNAYHALQEHGIEAGGVKYGADAARNTIGWTGQPVLRATRNNYFGHIYKESAQKIQQLAQKAGRMLRNGGSFNKQRTFETLRDAMDAGAHPHLNPFSVGAAHMIDMGRSINDVNLVNKLMELGSVRRLIPKANAAEATSEQLSMFDHGLQQAGHTIDHIPQGWMESEALPGFVTRPDMERMLRDHLGMDDQTGPIWNLLRSGTNKFKGYSMLLPTVHGRNVLGNAYLAGLNLKDIGRTATRIKQGTYDDMVERAMASGAISQESTGGRLIDQMNSHYAPNNTPLQKAMSGVRYLSHGALWDMDRFLRTSLFEKYTKQGMSDATAARLVNKNMVDYSNLTPFERKYVSTIIPFYSWKKGNLPLQVSHWINNTPRQVAYMHANNAIQNSINGQNTGPDGKLDFGTLADGSHVKFDNYFPGEDPLKIMNDGLLPYAFSSLNPYLKEGINQAMNHAYYPGTAFAPNGKESMVKTQIRPDGAPLSENIKSTIGSVANQFIPSSGIIGSATAALMGSKDGRGLVNSGINNVLGGAQQTNSNPASPMTLGEILGKATGGFTSRDNPALDAYYQQKDAQTQHKAQDTWKKAHGQPVSKQDWAYDNKKIPYPVVTSPLGN